ncbi:MAG TPA: TonB-dependent receptor, partial [Chitinophagaceae bacterium]|nr:TonB-dependent receptor [Chitinophagaceae bacterium]
TNLALNLSLNVRVTPWLSAMASGNIGRYFSESELYWEPDSYDARMMINTATSLNTAGARVYGLPTGGKLDMNSGSGRTYSLRGQLAVDKSWNSIHRLNVLAGTEIREKYDKTTGEVRYGYDKSINSFRSVSAGSTYRTMYNSTQTISATSKAMSELTTRSLSYFANAAYTFDNKYTVTGSARFDDFNLLGVDRRKRAIPLWSGGVKWNLKNERFLQHVPWINQLSARATYGISGNAPQGYAPVTVVFISGADFYTGYPYASVSTPAVDNLAWEKTRMANYGIDYSLFNSRLFGSVEYYRKKTTDIIWQMPINSTYGFSTTLFNTGNLTGKGVDISLNVVPVALKNFRWTAFMNLSYNTNIMKDVRFKTATTSFSPENLYDGYPTDYLFSYLWGGLDNTGQALIKDPLNPQKTYTVNDFPFENIRVYSGRTTSPWFGGFGSSFEYKGFSLSCMFSYQFGGVYRKPSINNIGFSNNTNVGRIGDLAQRWRKPGDEAFTNVPGLEFGANTIFNQSVTRYSESTYLIRSKSSIHLRQVSLSYNVPKQLIAKAGMKGLSLSAVARNLGMIWAK